MRVRNKIMLSAYCYNGIWGFSRNSGAGGGGGKPPDPAAQNAPQNGNGNQQQPPPQSGTNTQTNVDPNDALIDDIWKETKAKPNPNEPAPTQQQQTAPTQTDPAKDVDTYLNSIGLGELKLSETELESFKTGDGVQAVIDNINKRIRDSHVKALSGASTLIEKKVKDAVELAVNSSKSFYQGEQLRGLLQDKLPWTKDPVIAPMAETVLRQLLTKGATYEQGIEGTKKYFERVQLAMDPSYVAPNKNTQGSYGNNARKPDQGNTDWLKVLSPGNS